MKTVHVIVTGGFDPIHSGHIAYFESAKSLGDTLWVGLNSDEWLSRKKGQFFMDIEERKNIISKFSMVDYAFTFNDEKDYDKIHEDDVFNFIDLESFSPNNQLSLEIIHSDSSKEIIKLNHTFNSQQIEWYKNGSALNLIKSNNL